MARASSLGENACLTGSSGLSGTATQFGLHSADPTTVGSNEISGGSYARQAITWGTASAGSMANATTALVVPVPASTTVAYFGTWNTATVSGTTGYAVGGALSSSQTFSTAGTFTVAIGGLTMSIS